MPSSRLDNLLWDKRKADILYLSNSLESEKLYLYKDIIIMTVPEDGGDSYPCHHDGGSVRFIDNADEWFDHPADTWRIEYFDEAKHRRDIFRGTLDGCCWLFLRRRLAARQLMNALRVWQRGGYDCPVPDEILSQWGAWNSVVPL